MKPFVSIITPTYNHENFISQCIKSVINQTYTNWEQIIIDDCSIDSTYSIAKSYAKLDPRIRIVRHPNKWGIGNLQKTYNQALKLCKGNYVAILEGDDFWPQDKLEKQIVNLQHDDVVLSYGDWIMTDEKGNPIRLYTYNNGRNLLNNSPIGSILLLFSNLNFFLHPGTVMIKKQALTSIVGFQNNKEYPFVDIPTFLHLAIKGKFSYRREILGYYRKQQNSAWFDFAVSTTSMGRNETKKCLDNFIDKNTSLIDMKINYNQQNLLDRNKFIAQKQKNRKLSLLFNYLAFNEKARVRNIAKKILRSKSDSLLNKTTTLTLIFLSSIGVNPFNIIFKLQYLTYQTKRIFRV